ncbi:MAG: hypothetical protein F6K50_22370 [Moorea sp. SIO3I7]|nr:hypothetical protein [Moorena sp. SIO3I7]NEO07528.1 hypothetical protein [Moorena sp. SIO3I8]NEO25001.1 hypothetical protein [Moorena sp. SIO4A5]NEO62884.1 hypothetical protein [Moorena sp. SIO4G2]
MTSLTDLKVIGEYDDPELIVSKLEQMKDPEFLEQPDVREKGVEDILNIFNSVQNPPWSHATHQFGYIAPPPPGSTEVQVIQHPSAIKADPTLKNSRLNIRLDRLRIHKYPGGGLHNVLVSFAARNQVADAQEFVSFSQTYRVPEGQSAGIAGYPVFIGLNVGSQGIAFECSTVNVKNEADQAVLSALESSPFQTGLELLTTAQPAIAPFTTLTLGLVKALAKRNENVPVQKFYLGLDFEDAAMGIRLAEGNYIAVQVPDETTIDWNKWIYKPQLGQILHKADGSSLEYNYLVFRVSRYVD